MDIYIYIYMDNVEWCAHITMLPKVRERGEGGWRKDTTRKS